MCGLLYVKMHNNEEIGCATHLSCFQIVAMLISKKKLNT